MQKDSGLLRSNLAFLGCYTMPSVCDSLLFIEKPRFPHCFSLIFTTKPRMTFSDGVIHVIRATLLNTMNVVNINLEVTFNKVLWRGYGITFYHRLTRFWVCPKKYRIVTPLALFNTTDIRCFIDEAIKETKGCWEESKKLIGGEGRQRSKLQFQNQEGVCCP